MRRLAFLLALILSLNASAQSKDEIALLSGTKNLQMAIFGQRDSAVLEKFFAPVVTYGHSSGKIESRDEAIRNILQNKSTYTEVDAGGVNNGGISVQVRGKTGVTRHLLTANEHTAEGKINPLKLHILMVWVREGKSWKLMSRQAVRVP